MFSEQLDQKEKKKNKKQNLKRWFSKKVDRVGEGFHSIFSKLQLEGTIGGCFPGCPSFID